MMKIRNSDDNIFDARGYRYNVGIVIINDNNEVFWGRRVRQNSWQFPQGGMHAGESSEQSMYRELYEETGLLAEHISVLGTTKNWLQYRLPLRYRRSRRQGVIQCVGQKQKWFLLRLNANERTINLSNDGTPEFDFWRWVPYWQPINNVVSFKRDVYQQALEELSTYIPIVIKDKPLFADTEDVLPSHSRRNKKQNYSPKRRHRK